MSVHLGKIASAGSTKVPFDSRCGICREETGGGGLEGFAIWWPKTKFCLVHNRCYERIKPAADRVAEVIYSLSKGVITEQGERAYGKAIQAVQGRVFPETIDSFVSRKGIDALIEKFNTIGRDVAIDSFNEGGSLENEIELPMKSVAITTKPKISRDDSDPDFQLTQL